MSTFESKYPEIVIDKDPNSPNSRMIHNLTVEQYYDLMHHTHENIGTGDPSADSTYKEILEKVNSMQGTIKTITEENNSLKQEINSMKNEISDIKSNSSGVYIGDMDATTPEIDS